MAEWTIYQNLCKVFAYREAEGSHNHNLSRINMEQLLAATNYIVMRGQRKNHAFRPDATIFILFARSSSEIPTSKPKFDNAVKALDIRGGGYCEVLFAFATAVSVHVQKQFENGLGQAHPNVYFEVATHDIFTMEAPKHVLCGTHRILSPAERADYSRSIYQKFDSFARISPSDPMSIWYGIRPGDVVEIKTASETAGEVVRLRYCA